MSGTELVSVLKNDIKTSHIPLILLTALKGSDNATIGYRSGADDYIEKPFSKQIVLLKIVAILRRRNDILQKIAIEKTISVNELDISSLDEKLFDRILQYIENHLSDTDFDVEKLSEAIGIHRSHLNRKLKAITGHSPIDFIKMIRMRKAAELLKTGKMNVSEVAYEIGYSNPRYFSVSFKEYYGVSPSEYVQSLEA